MQNIRFDIPKDVKHIIKILSVNGHEGYIVGGCVRDMLLNLVPEDYDITTDALPSEMISIFNKEPFRLILNGVKHGTVGIVYKGNIYETTTFRIDGEYKDSRRPDKVQFTTKLQEDLSRRDFTINAMAYNDKIGLVDLFNGTGDLNCKIIRAVGDPVRRFNEDALRLMRGVRFAAKYNFTIEYNTLNALGETASCINNISMERIQIEFNKILLYNPKYILILNDFNILKNLPCSLINEDRFFANLEHCVNIASMSRQDLKLRLAIIFQNVREVGVLLTTMKYDKKTIKYVSHVVSNIGVLDKIQDYSITERNIKIKELLGCVGTEIIKDILYIKKLNTKDSSLKFDTIENVLSSIIERDECFSLDNLNITGKELCSLGIKGKEVGDILNYILGEVIKDNTINKKAILKEMIKYMP